MQKSVIPKKMSAVGASPGQSAEKPEASAYGSLQTFGLIPNRTVKARGMQKAILVGLPLVFLTTCLLYCPRLFAQETAQIQEKQPGWYMGREIAPTMSASGAEWLTRKTRQREEQPRKLLKALQVKHGQQVCDFGCGNGYYTLPLARAVGPRGKVFAVDIQQEMLDLLDARAQPRGLENIEPVLATLADPKLPRQQLDLVLMVDVYHELFQPAVILQAIHASLNETGRLVLVEFREEDPEVPIRPLHKMSQQQVRKEIGANRFKLVGQFNELPWQHVLFFARDDSSLPKKQLVPWKAEELVRPIQEIPPGESEESPRKSPGN